MRRHLFALVSVLLVACSGQSSATPVATSSVATTGPTGTVAMPPSTPAAATSLPASTPTVFTSPLYGYSVTLPPGWSAGAAMIRWDGKAQPGNEEAVNDRFGGPQSASAWAYAGPVSVDLKAFVKERIAATKRDHGDTCKADPEVNEPVQVGGEPGSFIAWNCGILINMAMTVRDGIGYSFNMRDFSVAAATDPTDRALLQQLLDGVVFPD